MDHLYQTGKKQNIPQLSCILYARSPPRAYKSKSFFSLLLILLHTYLTGWCGRKGSARDAFDGIVVFYYMFPITHTFSGVDYKERVILVPILPKITVKWRLYY